MDPVKIKMAMDAYRSKLGRTQPWRVAFNRRDVTMVAHKLTRDDIGTMLTALGRTTPYLGERLYREESYSPAYEFGEGDWVCVDIAPGGGFKEDKDGITLVRTINEISFETTYNRIS
jgi:hypothetical protein